jgi:hypothetical protein
LRIPSQILLNNILISFFANFYFDEVEDKEMKKSFHHFLTFVANPAATFG